MDTRREEIVPRRTHEQENCEEPLRRGHSNGRTGARSWDWRDSRCKPDASEPWAANENGDRMVEGLGWFSVGLGLAAVAAPRGLSRLIGLDNHRLLLRIVGLREIASGVGILTNRKPAAWL